MSNLGRVQSMSRKLRIVFMVILCALPLFQVLFWIFFNHLPEETVHRFLPIAVQQDLAPGTRLMGLAASCITTIVVMACAYDLIRLFGLYERAEIFSERTVGYLRSLGRLLIGLFFAEIVQQPLMTLALTLHNPPGHRMITLGLGSDNLSTLLFGIVVVLIAWVMDEGRKYQDEVLLTV